jgi:hypothetical protein
MHARTPIHRAARRLLGLTPETLNPEACPVPRALNPSRRLLPDHCRPKTPAVGSRLITAGPEPQPSAPA